MNLRNFLLILVCQGALNDSILELNAQWSSILGFTPYIFKQIIRSGHLSSNFSYSVVLLNNTLEQTLELHYFEFTSDDQTNLAHSFPDFQRVVRPEYEETKNKFENYFNLSTTRFGVLQERRQDFEVLEKNGENFAVKLEESLVYAEEDRYCFVVVGNRGEEIAFRWKTGRVVLSDRIFAFRIFICPFLLGIVVSVVALYCYNSRTRKFPCFRYSELNESS